MTGPSACPRDAMMRLKILVVDDSPTAIMWHRMILKDQPYELVIAHDGEEGVRAAEASRPDLILMDVMMPRMNGLEACKAIRALPGLSRIPVFFVSTRSELATVQNGYESGCNEYLTKPIDRTELLAKVRQYLGPAASATPAMAASAGGRA